MPIYHSDYLRGLFEYTDLNRKEKQKFQEMLFLLCNLVNPDVPFEFVEFYINQERFFPSFIKKKDYTQLLADFHINNIQVNVQSELPRLTDDFLGSDKSLKGFIHFLLKLKILLILTFSIIKYQLVNTNCFLLKKVINE